MIGIYGGTFDPIHFGHLRPVLDVVEILGIKKCHFIPCSIPHHRESPRASSQQRLEMVAAAIKTESRFYLDAREINRDGVSYSIDTVHSIQSELPESQILCLIIGIDAFTKFDQWYQWQFILNLCHIIVTHRPGWDIQTFDGTKLLSNDFERFISNRIIKDKDELRKSKSGKILFLSVTQLDISATKIRSLLARNNSIQYLIPDDVITIIQKQNIYVN